MIALAVSLGVLWLNLLLTGRWAAVDGSINGPKRPWFVAALVAATVLCVWHLWQPADRTRDRGEGTLGPWSARLVALAGVAFLGGCFFVVWFPPATWSQIPFLDNWPSRYQATLDLVSLIDHGTLAGWQWHFLGGYHSSSDITVSLGLLAYLPMKLLGDAPGFHLFHLFLMAAVPALIWLDLSLDDTTARSRGIALVAAGVGGLLTASYSYFLFRSGDTNSLAGVVTAFAALVGAHAARRRCWWGTPLLVVGLTLAEYSHAAFFIYAGLFLALDALVARDWRSGARAGVALLAAMVAALPLTWESWRYPAFFDYNNVRYAASAGFDLSEFVHKLWYNVELLWLPGRRFNDFTGLTLALLPVAAVLALVDRTRVRFHAWALIGAVALVRLDDAQFGYAFIRPIYMYVVFLAPVLAALVVRYVPSRRLAWSLLATCAIYTQVWYHEVPHIPNIRAFDSSLVDRVAQADGALVLVENNPHRNMDADPGGKTAPSRFGVHFEPLLAAATGRRLYAGYWDGWQWNPWKGQLVAGGTFMGRALGSTPHDAFAAEMRRWGVVNLFVWSGPTQRYLDADPRFAPVWREGAWTEYRFADADPRGATVEHGQATVAETTPIGAEVVLSGVTRGEPVVVRTNFYPAWTARANGQPVALEDDGGQLAFRAPCDGDCRVTLAYPTRPLLVWLALAAMAGGIVVATRW